MYHVLQVMFSSEFWNADEVHNHSSVSDTEPHLTLLVSYCSQVSNYRTAGSLLTHTHILDPASSYAHTHYFHYRGVSERECSISLSVCQPSDPSFIWMETGEVEFCPLQFEHFPSATVHLFALPATLSGLSFTFPFFITNLGELAGPMLSGFSAFPLFTLSLSLFVTFLSHTVFTQPLCFLTPALLFTLLSFLYLFLPSLQFQPLSISPNFA